MIRAGQLWSRSGTLYPGLRRESKNGTTSEIFPVSRRCAIRWTSSTSGFPQLQPASRRRHQDTTKKDREKREVASPDHSNKRLRSGTRRGSLSIFFCDFSLEL